MDCNVTSCPLFKLPPNLTPYVSQKIKVVL